MLSELWVVIAYVEKAFGLRKATRDDSISFFIIVLIV